MSNDKFRLRNWERFQEKKKKEKARKAYAKLKQMVNATLPFFEDEMPKVCPSCKGCVNSSICPSMNKGYCPI